MKGNHKQLGNVQHLWSHKRTASEHSLYTLIHDQLALGRIFILLLLWLCSPTPVYAEIQMLNDSRLKKWKAASAHHNVFRLQAKITIIKIG